MEENKKYKSLSDEEIDDMCLSYGWNEYEFFMKSLLKLASRLERIDNMDEDGHLGLSQLIRLQIFQKLYGLNKWLLSYRQSLMKKEGIYTMTRGVVNKMQRLVYIYIERSEIRSVMWPEFRLSKTPGHYEFRSGGSWSSVDDPGEFDTKERICSLVDIDMITDIKTSVDTLYEELNHMPRIQIGEESVNFYISEIIRYTNTQLMNLEYELPQVNDNYFCEYVDHIITKTVIGDVFFKSVKNRIKEQLDSYSSSEKILKLHRMKIELVNKLEKVGLATIINSEYEPEIEKSLDCFCQKDGSMDRAKIGSFLYRHSGMLTWSQFQAFLNYLALLDYKCSDGEYHISAKKKKGGNTNKELFVTIDGSIDMDKAEYYACELKELFAEEGLETTNIPTKGRGIELLAETFVNWQNQHVIEKKWLNLNGYYRFLTEEKYPCNFSIQTSQSNVVKRLGTLIDEYKERLKWN